MVKKILSIFAIAASTTGFSQVHFSETFESGLGSWINVDGDTDPAPASGTNFDIWYTANFSAYDAALGAGSAVSRSWASNVVYHPNNFLTSPAINLSAVGPTGLNLIFTVGTIEGSPFQAEHYAIYVSTASDTTSILATTPVFEETISDPAAFNTKIVNLAAYAGQTVYLTLRHFNSVDMNTLIIDNILVKTLAPNDANLVSSSLTRYAQVSTNNSLTMQVKNEGSSTITSLAVDWNDGTSHLQTISGLNIATGATATVTHPTAVSAATPVEKNINITITQVNAAADANPADNTGAKKFNTVSTVAPKAVVIEEGTGTWCGWCPRGAVAMEALTLAHPTNFIGIAVHNSDPMTLTEYDAAANFSGFPGANVDRELLGVSVSSALFDQYYNSRISMTVPAKVTIGGTVSGNTVNLVAGTEFYTPMTGADFRLAVVITEDEVTGTASGYNQTNYYSSQSQNLALSGAGHNWQTEPNPVPAASMSYDHVGIALLGGYDGLAGSVPATIVDGTTGTAAFTYAIPSTSNVNKMHAVALLIDNSTGVIVNAISSPLNGLVGIKEVAEVVEMMVYPNPASDLVNVAFEANGGNYTISATDIHGVTISAKEMSNVSGAQSLSLPVSGLAAGVYFITISHEGVSSTRRIIVQ
jgi:hypothetical protein